MSEKKKSKSKGSGKRLMVSKHHVAVTHLPRTVGSIFLDSGAHSLYSIEVINKAHKDGYAYYRTKRFKRYVNRYAQFLKEHKDAIDLYVNVDAIFNPELTWQVQKYLEEYHGLKPIPVIHYGTPFKWVDRYLNAGHTYLGIGGLGQEVTRKMYYDWADRLFDRLCPASNHRKPIVKTHGFAMTSYPLLIRYPWYCMTDEHEVLTKSGWKGRERLTIGEEILAYDHSNGTSNWEVITDKPVFDLTKEEVIRFQNRNMLAATTAGHRWPVIHKNGDRSWKTSAELMKSKTAYQIPRSSEYRGFPLKETYSDEVIELLAWFWTDGSRRRRPKYKNDSIAIYQSDRNGSEKAKKIIKLLYRCEGGFSESRLKSNPHEIHFEVWGHTANEVLKLAPTKDKEFDIGFILKLTKRQLKLFLDTVLLGDGGWDKKMVREKCFVLPQKGGRNLEVMRVAATLLGLPTSYYDSSNGLSTLRSSSVHTVYSDKLEKTKEEFTGKVWCVSVPSRGFYTKCGGHVYITGNSVDSASWAKLAGFGCIYVPHLRNGIFDFSKTPYTIGFSYRSEAAKVSGAHYLSLRDGEKRVIEKWLDFIKMPIGKVDKDGKPLEYGVLSQYNARAVANLLFFEKLCEWLPKWPWAFKVHVKRGLFPEGLP